MNPCGAADQVHKQQSQTPIYNTNEPQEQQIQPEGLGEVVLFSEDVAFADGWPTIDGPSILVLHQSLEPILEHRDILKRVEQLGHLREVVKEPSHQHQGNDGDWRQGHRHVEVLNQCRYHQRVGSSTEVHKLKCEESPEKYVPLVVEVTGEVGNYDVDERNDNLDRERGTRFAPEIGGGCVSVVHSLPNEDRSLGDEGGQIGEDTREGCCYCEKE